MHRGAIGVLAGCLAFDAAAAGGRVVFFSDFESECTWDDIDADRLSGCAEAGLKLDPALRDTDGDGLADGDEALGTLSGLDLPAMGVDPRRKNILLEYDWFVDANEAGGPNNCAPPGPHSHRPSQGALDIVTVAFAAAPASNPDGSLGIDVVHDVGQGGALGGGSEVPDTDGIVDGSATGAEYTQAYNAHFALNRRGYFHYVLLPHGFVQNGVDNLSGSAQVDDGTRRDRMMVSMHCQATDEKAGNTILHELGHNLGLRHGGGTDCNYKPNYDSIMNYRFQFDGVDVDCDGLSDHVADFSRGLRIAIDENAVDETRGVCGDQPIDFTASDGLQPAVLANLNSYANEPAQCGGVFTVLADHDDWAGLEIGVDATMLSDDAGAPIDEAIVCGALP
jgi:hypothetical protein